MSRKTFLMCVFQTPEDDTVTIRDRDTMEQKRVAISSLEELTNLNK